MAAQKNWIVVVLFFLTMVFCFGALGADWFTIYSQGSSVISSEFLNETRTTIGDGNPLSISVARSNQQFLTIHGLRRYVMREVIDARRVNDATDKVFGAAITVSIRRYYWSQSGYERCYLNFEEREDSLATELSQVKSLMLGEEDRVCNILKNMELDGCDDSYLDLGMGILGQHWLSKAMCGAMGPGVFTIVIVCAILALVGIALCLGAKDASFTIPIKYLAATLVFLLTATLGIYITEAEAWIGTTYDLDYNAAMRMSDGIRTFQAGPGLVALAAFLMLIAFIYLHFYGIVSGDDVPDARLVGSAHEQRPLLSSRDQGDLVYKAGGNAVSFSGTNGIGSTPYFSTKPVP